MIPLALILLIMGIDYFAPSEIHLGPLLVAAPAITASFAGPRLAGAIGLLAVAGQFVLGWHDGTLGTSNVRVQVIALATVTVLVMGYAYLRQRDRWKLGQIQTVAEAAQRVVLRPLPERIGPLRIATEYLAAEAEAQIGGDLYGAVHTRGSTKLIVGDVRGKGLEAISDAGLLLGAFREAAHRQTILPLLVTDLERSLASDRRDFHQADAIERFITAAILEVPDDDWALHLVNCGHPAPLLLRDGQVTALNVVQPAPPIGLGDLAGTRYTVHTFPFEAGDVLLLYTDGVLEARDGSGAFYPLAERLPRWADHGPAALCRSLRKDLLAYAGGHLGDDAAMIAIERLRVGPLPDATKASRTGRARE
ncbi:PP2C family protein-serine/threonine phosphatase [Streptosporangium soli]|nr:serine/threonine-protein phosphatase [Streptosporangium sp. KLBMP 9127]